MLKESRYIAIGLGVLCFIGLSSFPGWHAEKSEDDESVDVKPFPSRFLMQGSLGLIAAATLLTFLSIIWQHISSASATAMAGDLAYGNIVGHVGPAAMILGWAGVVTFLLSTIGLLVMILSIRVLTELVDDFDDSET